MWLTKQRQKMWVWCQVSERYLLQIKMHQIISTSVCGRVTRHYAVFRTKMMKVVNRSVFVKEASWQWRRTNNTTYCIRLCTIPAGPETRTRNLRVTSPTLYPLGHHCPSDDRLMIGSVRSACFIAFNHSCRHFLSGGGSRYVLKFQIGACITPILAPNITIF